MTKLLLQYIGRSGNANVLSACIHQCSVDVCVQQSGASQTVAPATQIVVPAVSVTVSAASTPVSTLSTAPVSASAPVSTSSSASSSVLTTRQLPAVTTPVASNPPTPTQRHTRDNMTPSSSRNVNNSPCLPNTTQNRQNVENRPGNFMEFVSVTLYVIIFN